MWVGIERAQSKKGVEPNSLLKQAIVGDTRAKIGGMEVLVS